MLKKIINELLDFASVVLIQYKEGVKKIFTGKAGHARQLVEEVYTSLINSSDQLINQLQNYQESKSQAQDENEELILGQCMLIDVINGIGSINLILNRLDSKTQYYSHFSANKGYQFFCLLLTLKQRTNIGEFATWDLASFERILMVMPTVKITDSSTAPLYNSKVTAIHDLYGWLSSRLSPITGKVYLQPEHQLREEKSIQLQLEEKWQKQARVRNRRKKAPGQLAIEELVKYLSGDQPTFEQPPLQSLPPAIQTREEVNQIIGDSLTPLNSPPIQYSSDYMSSMPEYSDVVVETVNRLTTSDEWHTSQSTNIASIETGIGAASPFAGFVSTPVQSINDDEDTDSQLESVAKFDLVKNLIKNLEQIIVRRLNQIKNREAMNEEYKPLIDKIKEQQGVYGLALLPDDFSKIARLINTSMEETQDDANQTAKIQQAVLQFFKSYKITYQNAPDAFRWQSEHPTLQFIALTENLNHVANENGNKIRGEVDQLNDQQRRHIRIDDLTANALLFNQVELVMATKSENITPEPRLVLTIDPPGSSTNPKYSLRLILAKMDETGYCSFIPVSEISETSGNFAIFTQLKNKLHPKLIGLLYKQIADDAEPVFVSTVTLDDLQQLKSAICTNNADNNATLLLPIIPMSCKIPAKTAKRKLEETTEQDNDIAASKPKRQKAVIDKKETLVKRKIINPTANRTYLTKNASTSLTGHVSLATNDEDDNALTLASFLEDMQGSNLSRLTLRNIAGKVSKINSLIPKGAKYRMVKFTHQHQQVLRHLEHTIATNLNAPFAFRRFQNEGIKHFYQYRRGGLFDEMGTGKTYQLIAQIHLWLNDVYSGNHNKFALVVLPVSLIRQWQYRLSTAGLSPFVYEYNLNREIKPEHKICLISYDSLQSALNNHQGLRRKAGYIASYRDAYHQYYNMQIDYCVTRDQLIEAIKTLGYIGQSSILSNHVISTLVGKSEPTDYIKNLPTEEQVAQIALLLNKDPIHITMHLASLYVFDKLKLKGLMTKDNMLLVKNFDKLITAVNLLYIQNPNLENAVSKDFVLNQCRRAYDEFEIDLMILDEGHKITSSQSTKLTNFTPLSVALKQRGGRCYLATGTPVRHHRNEYANSHFFISPDLFLNPKTFNTNYNKLVDLPIKNAIKAFCLDSYNDEMKALFMEKMTEGYQIISDAINFMSKQQLRRRVSNLSLADGIPDQVDIDCGYELTPYEQAIYNQNKVAIDQFCRDYSRDLKGDASARESESELILPSRDDEYEYQVNINMTTLSKLFMHPILLDEISDEKLYAENVQPHEYIEIIEEYIQNVCHGNFYEFIGQSGRLSKLVELLSSIDPREKVIIKIESISFMHILQYVIERHPVLANFKVSKFNGELSKQAKDAVVRDFMNPLGQTNTVLISNAGKEGIEFSAAKHVIIEPEWDKSSTRQFIARAKRIGNPHVQVFVYDLYGDPMSIKKRSFCSHKDNLNDFIFNEDRNMLDLFKLTYRELLKDEKRPEMKLRLRTNYKTLKIMIREQLGLVNTINSMATTTTTSTSSTSTVPSQARTVPQTTGVGEKSEKSRSIYGPGSLTVYNSTPNLPALEIATNHEALKIRYT